VISEKKDQEDIKLFHVRIGIIPEPCKIVSEAAEE